ncbi:MAG: hypothetical protein ACF8PN_13595 [Phycisphaerales bacterium]
MGDGSDKAKDRTRSRRRRRWVTVVGVVVLALLAIAVGGVFFAPRILSTDAGVEFIEARLNRDPALRIDIGSLDLRWSGRQRVSGLQVASDEDGYTTNLDLVWNGSLWELIRGRRDLGELIVSGEVEATIGRELDEPTDEPEEPTELPSDFAVELLLDSLAIVIRDASPDQRFGGDARLDEINGSIALGVGEPLEFDLGGVTTFGDQPGGFDAEGAISDFLSVAGVEPYEKWRSDARLQATGIPSAFLDRLLGQDGRLASIIGEAVSGDLRLDGDPVDGAVTLELIASRAQASMALAMTSDRVQLTEPAFLEVDLGPRSLEAWLPNGGASEWALEPTGRWRLEIDALEAARTGPSGIDLADADLDATLTGASFVFARQATTNVIEPTRLSEITLRIASEDVAQAVSFSGSADLRTGAASSLLSPESQSIAIDGELAQAFSADGAIRRDSLSLTASLSGANIPAGRIDDGAELDGWLVDAMGDTLDSFGLDLALGPGIDGPVRVDARIIDDSDSLSIAVRVDENSIRLEPDGPALLSWRARPELQTRLANLLGDSWSIEPDSYESPLSLTIDELTIPRLDGSYAWESMAFSAGAELNGWNARYHDLNPALTLGANATVRIATDTLSESVTMQLDDATVRVDEVSTPADAIITVAHPLDENARLLTARAALERFPATVLADRIGRKGARVTEIVGEAPTVRLEATRSPEGFVAGEATLMGERSDWSVTVEHDDESHTFSAAGSQVITPGVVASFQREDPLITLYDDLPVDLVAEPIRVSNESIANLGLIEAVKSSAIVARAASEASGRIFVRDLATPATAVQPKAAIVFESGFRGPLEARLQGSARDDDGDDPLGSFDLWVRREPAEPKSHKQIRLTMEDLYVEPAERLFGYEPTTLTGWLGEYGRASLTMEPMRSEPGWELSINADFSRSTGQLFGQVTDERILFYRPSRWQSKVAAARFGGWMDEHQITNGITSAEDIDLDIKFNRVEVPRNLLDEETLTPERFGFELTALVPTVTLLGPEPLATFNNLELTLGGANIVEGLGYLLKGDVVSPTDTPGTINLSGIARTQTVAWNSVRTDLQGDIEGFPVGLLDRLAELDDRLEASLGASMSVKAHLVDASFDSGRVTLRMSSDNGWMNVRDAEFQGGTLVTTTPVRAMLDVTPVMAATVLRDVNPMLYDLRKKGGPMLLEANDIRLPLDGDVSRLNGSFTLDLGQVNVAATGFIGELLGSLRDETSGEQTGTIPPVKARIRNGVLTYDELMVQTPEFDITTWGSVNLATRTLELGAAVPLIGWKRVFGDMVDVDNPVLGDISPDIPFYLVIEGTIDDPVVRPDPDGAEKVADDFFQGMIGNVLDRVFDPAGTKKNRNRRDRR